MAMSEGSNKDLIEKETMDTVWIFYPNKNIDIKFSAHDAFL